MDPCSLAALAGVFIGWALGAGTQPRAIVRALGGGRAGKLIRLLELLEEPDGEEDQEEPAERERRERRSPRPADDVRAD